ncbi:TPA: hypothetical protein HA251_03075 [Candidatus Woesearchaeota archaeon]|nr:hypothetical protein [Candidatus Woesearchaeota archaeon]
MVQVRRERVIAMLLLIALFAPLVHAASYSVAVTPVDNDIWRNESAEYDVEIASFGTETGDFQVYTVDPNWNVKTNPLTIIVTPETPNTFKLYLRPSSSASYGTQGVSITFKDLNTGAIIQRSVVLSLLNPDGSASKDYAATVNIDFMLPYDVDPRAPIPLRMQLRNRNPLNISDLEIRVSSPHFNAKANISLPPLSERTKDLPSATIDPLTPPGEAEILIELVYQGAVVNQMTKNYRIKEYTQIKQLIGTREFFFKTEKTVTVNNDGNVDNKAVVTVPTSLLKNLFVGSSLPYEIAVIDGQRSIVWEIPLKPSETKAFTYTENYRILVLLALLAIMAGIAYFVLRSPVTTTKEAVAIAHGDGVSDIKVRLFVRNRSAKIIQSIQLTDKVPSLADVHKTDTPGNTAPSKVAQNERHGTLLRWDFDVLEPYEERVVTYQMKSKLKIIGKMKLPNARVKFTSKGRERAIYSNNIELIERFKDQ